MKLILASIVMVFALLPVTDAADIYVSPKGSDTNPGTRAAPFATVAKAQLKARSIRHEANTIWLTSGDYLIDESIVFTAEDSGTAVYPLTIRSMTGGAARLVGGRVVDPSAFLLVSDPETLDRFRPNARPHIRQLDLAELGLRNTRAWDDLIKDNGGIIELFVNSRRMPLAVYPNNYGDMTIKRVIVNGGGQEIAGDFRDYYNNGTPETRKAMQLGPPRPGVFEYYDEHQDNHVRWARVLDRGVWLKGYWRIPWQNETVRVAEIDTDNHTVKLAAPIYDGIGNKYHRPEGNGKEIYWVLNLPEEVDLPGEWAIDFVDQKLYFYPPEGFDRTEVLISDMREPIIRLDGARHVHIVDVHVEAGLSDAIRINGGRDNKVLGCTIRNVTHYGVWVEGGYEHEIRSNDLSYLGAGGIWLSGGDSSTSPRTPAGHRAINNHIHHFGQIERVYAPGINVGYRGRGGGSEKIDAIGMYVAHNVIHYGPHAGVLFNSFDNLFEYNEVFQWAMVSNDMGAFYSHSNPEIIGFNTFRYNLMHSSPEGDGIYIDKAQNHMVVESNIAYKLGPQDGKGRGNGFLVKNYNQAPFVLKNNVALRCKIGFSVKLGEGAVIESNVTALNYGEDVFVQAENTRESGPINGITIMGQPLGFADLANLDFRLDDNAPIFYRIPGFERIPVEKIGLMLDEFRQEIPDYRGDTASWSTDGSGGDNYEILDRD